MTALTVVCWRWGTRYTSKHVYVLRDMVRRHLSLDHGFVCVTDDPHSLKGIATLPMPKRPPGADKESIRLWLFSKTARVLGRRILNLDLDVVITGDVTPLTQREEPLVMWREDGPKNAHGFVLNPTVMLHTTGSDIALWEQFCENPARLLAQAKAAGWRGTEQAVISLLRPETAIYTRQDGIVSYRDEILPNGNTLPEDARVVSFHDKRYDPARQSDPWIRKYWRLGA